MVLDEGVAAVVQPLKRRLGRNRDAEIYTSLPGLGAVLAARVLGEFGEDPTRYVDSKARKA